MLSIKKISALLITGLMFGCGGSGTTSTGFVSEPTMAVVVTGSVVDAVTPTKNISVDVTVNAPAGTTVYKTDGTALPVPIKTTSTSAIQFALKTLPTEDVTLTVNAKADSYVPKSTVVLIKKGSAGPYSFSIALDSSSASADLPAGVNNALTTVTTDNSGSIPATTFGTQNVVGSKTTVTFPAGAVASNSSATLGGGLTLTTSNYNPSLMTSPAAMAPSDGGYLITAGYTDVSVRDASGNSATKLSKPMTIKMSIPADTINPETGVVVQAGDSITVYTYKTATGTWEADTSVSADAQAIVKLDSATSTLYVEFSANHFSYWNLGFKIGATVCNKTITLAGTGITASLTLKATSLGRTYFSAIKPVGETSISIANVPATGPVITYSAYYGSIVAPVGTVTAAAGGACSPQTLTATLPVTSYAWLVQKRCQYGPNEVAPFKNIAVYACPAVTATLQPVPVCSIVGVTNASGIANFVVQTGSSQVLFFVPSYQYQAAMGNIGPVALTAAPTTNFSYFDWRPDFACSVTGAN
jgi:hypothetical protein